MGLAATEIQEHLVRWFCFARVMPLSKVTLIVISICFLSLLGVLLTMILTTKVPTYSRSSHSLAENPMSSASTILFDYHETEHFVLDCITGDIVGVRPSNVATVDVRQLHSSNHFDLDQHRKAMFSKIFQKREWDKNSKVDFSASGKPPILSSGLTHKRTKLKVRAPS